MDVAMEKISDLEAENERQKTLFRTERAITKQLEAENERLRKENERLREVFHAAIRRPLGVVPACGDEFYDQDHPALRGE